jgi:hypothetical protein
MVLYHYTDPSNIKSILNHGLIKTKSNFWKGHGGCVYLMSDIPYDKEDKAVFRVNVDGLDYSQISDWEYICWDDIEPDKLTLVNWAVNTVVCNKCGKEHIAVYPIPVKFPCECFHCGEMGCEIKE